MTIEPRFLTDWSGLSRGVPDEVHRPVCTEDIAELVRSANERGCKITIQGGLTGLAGGAVPAEADIVVNLERMNRIEWLDATEGVMQVQAGATLQQVQEAAAAAGWFFPVDLGARGSCQIGGNAATNAGGDRVLRYGTMRDSVLGLEAVLADGTVVNSLTRLVKNSAGLDLRFLFIGSEGTLGIITRLVLRLQPDPGIRATALASVADMTSLTRLLKHLRISLGPQLSAYEFMSREFVEHARRHARIDPVGSADSSWHVLIESAGPQASAPEAALQDALESAWSAGLLQDCAVASSQADAQAFWRIRQSIPEILTALKPTVNFDCGLPLAQIENFVASVQPRLAAAYPEAAHLFFGHLGDNNIHILTGPHDPARHEAVETLVYDELRGRDGTISAEHGIGFIKKPFLSRTRNAEQLDLLRRLKHALDPSNTLNPGRILD
jgi:FAD/FMN-containing dehydrogenase